MGNFRHQLSSGQKCQGGSVIYGCRAIHKSGAACATGSGGAPSFEAFKSAFRFALRMRFDKSIDSIVRSDVLEARPTNIQKFKEVTESFRRLAQMIAQVKTKIGRWRKSCHRILQGGSIISSDNDMECLASVVAREEAIVDLIARRKTRNFRKRACFAK